MTALKEAQTFVALLALLMTTPCFTQSVGPQGRSKMKSCRSFAPFFHKFNPQLREFQIADKRSISADFSVWVVTATAPEQKVTRFATLREAMFGIFIVANSTGWPVMALDTLPTVSPGSLEIRIEEASSGAMVISKHGMDYGEDFGRVKYFYNLETRRVLKKIDFHSMNICCGVEFEGALYFAGTDNGATSIITKLANDPADPLRDYQIIHAVRGQRIPLIGCIRKEASALVFLSEEGEYRLSKGNWNLVPNQRWHEESRSQPLQVLPELPQVRAWVTPLKLRQNILELGRVEKAKHKLLVWNSSIWWNSTDGEKVSGIYEVAGGGAIFHPLPQPTYETFQEYRPRRVKDGYRREDTTIQEEIGPSHLVGDKLWFGTSFYDGEGTSGVGAVGAFDLRTKKYSVNFYKEIADWSASAILVEEKDIWLGLIRRPEGAIYSGGLARISLTDRSIEKYKIPAIVNKILKIGETIYLATSEGIYLIRGDRLVHLKFDLKMDGKYSLKLVEALLSEEKDG